MNCKPGDTARVVSNAETRRFGHADRFVRVVELDGKAIDGAPCWRLAEPLPCFWDPRGFEFCSDAVLRPIRDPGDDAQDETLAWKPVPLPAIQPELLEQS